MLSKKFRANFWLLSIAKGSGSIMGVLIFLLLARWLGAGTSTDAFFLVRRFITGLVGSIERAGQHILVPPLVRSLVADAEGRRGALPVRTMGAALALSILAAAGVAAGAEWIVRGLAPGFDAERVALATALMRIMAPVLPLTVAAAIALSFLNATRRFGLGGFAAQFPRLMMIVVILTTPSTVEALAWAMLVGSMLYAAVLVVPVVRVVRALLREQRTLTADAAHGAQDRRRLGAVALNQVEVQGVAWIDAAFATLIGAGVLSMLEYGQRLIALLPSLLSASLAAVAYTEMVHATQSGNMQAIRHTIVRLMRANLFLILPLTVITMGVADLLVAVLLQHGKFSAEAAAGTTVVLQLALPHMTFVAINGAILSAMVADSSPQARRILMVGIGVMLVSRIAIFAVVIKSFGLAGLMLGSATSLALGTVTFVVMLGRYCGGLFQRDDIKAFAVMALATAVAGAVIYATRLALPEISGGLIGQIISLGVSSVAGGAAYIAVTALLGLPEVGLLGLPRWKRAGQEL